ncbi:MAG: hypothetical protein LBK46_07920 [Oscillospiraceae bacterium]|nr:hypothetical protein [Oscillospiraceae bacterium]
MRMTTSKTSEGNDMNAGQVERLSKVEATMAYHGYTYSVGEALAIVILGSMCGLRNVCQIRQWALSESVATFFCQTLRS